MFSTSMSVEDDAAPKRMQQSCRDGGIHPVVEVDAGIINLSIESVNGCEAWDSASAGPEGAATTVEAAELALRQLDRPGPAVLARHVELYRSHLGVAARADG